MVEFSFDAFNALNDDERDAFGVVDEDDDSNGHLLRAQWANESQRAFVEDDSDFSAYVGGIGSGKTFGLCLKILSMPPRSRGMITAPTYRVLKDATIQTFIDSFGDFIVDYNKSDMWMELVDGKRILWRTEKNPDMLRGPTLDWAGRDEFLFGEEEVEDILSGRLRGQIGPRVMFSSSSPAGRNWGYYRYHPEGRAEGKDGEPYTVPGYSMHRAKTRDNSMLPPSYWQKLEAQYKGKQASQELDGEFVDFSGGFIEKDWFHIHQTRPEIRAWFRYWDLATSTKQKADSTASARIGRDASGVYWCEVGPHFKTQWPTTRQRIISQAHPEPLTIIGVEAQGFQLGAYQDVVHDVQKLPRVQHRMIVPVNVHTDKITRALPWVSAAARGELRFVNSPLLKKYIDECVAAPGGEHDDCLDAISGAWAMASNPKGVVIVPDKEDPRRNRGRQRLTQW